MNTLPVEKRKNRWLELRAGKEHDCMLVDITDSTNLRPEPWPDKMEERLDWAVRQYDLMAERAEHIDDDRIPFISIYTGTEIFAECFGSPVARPVDEMPFALPAVRNSAEAARLKRPRLEDTKLPTLFELAERALENRPGAVLGMPDVQSPFDVAALIWDKAEFYPALLEDPEAIRSTSMMVEDLECEFLSEWIRRFGSGFIAHYPSYYIENAVTMSVDEVGAISTEIFNDQVAPELVRMSMRFGGLGIHCCADAMHQWPLFAELPGLALVNFMPVKYEAARAFPVIGSKAAQMHQWKDTLTWKDRVATVPAEARVVWWWPANSEEEARSGLAELREALVAAGRI